LDVTQSMLADRWQESWLQ